jgi:hypothetical protein
LVLRLERVVEDGLNEPRQARRAHGVQHHAAPIGLSVAEQADERRWPGHNFLADP